MTRIEEERIDELLAHYDMLAKDYKSVIIRIEDWPVVREAIFRSSSRGEVKVKPWDTRPQGQGAMDPDEVNVFEGSWALVMGTNANPAGWIDTHALFAGQTYRDQILSAIEQEQAEPEDVSGEQIMNVAHRIQSILADTLKIEDGEIIMTGPASYKIARLFKPAPTRSPPEIDVGQEAPAKPIGYVSSAALAQLASGGPWQHILANPMGGHNIPVYGALSPEAVK